MRNLEHKEISRKKAGKARENFNFFDAFLREDLMTELLNSCTLGSVKSKTKIHQLGHEAAIHTQKINSVGHWSTRHFLCDFLQVLTETHLSQPELRLQSQSSHGQKKHSALPIRGGQTTFRTFLPEPKGQLIKLTLAAT